MVNVPKPERASFLSTGVVSRELGIDAEILRSMIESGSLPQPHWMSLGSKVERIYSLEWLLLASERLNARRLPGLEYGFNERSTIQIVLRFTQFRWTLDEIATKLAALSAFWDLCATTVEPEASGPPPLDVQRLSAGSPLDVLMWVDSNWGGVLGTGAAASLFVYAVRHPDRIVDAIPRAMASWREQRARADNAAVLRLEAPINRKRFELRARALLAKLDAVPSESVLSGEGAAQLEIFQPETIRPEETEEGQLDAPGDESA